MKRLLPLLLCLLTLAVPRLYGQDCTITFSADPAEGGSVIVKNQTDNYATVHTGDKVSKGSRISVTATEGDGYEFDHWEIDGQSSSEYTRVRFEYVVEKDVTFKASYRKLENLAVTFSAEGPGSIRGANRGRPITSGQILEEGTTLHFYATADADAEFRDWTVNGVKESEGIPSLEYEVQKGKPNTVVANFVSTATTQEYVVTFVADPVDGGTVTAENTATYMPVKSGASVAESSFLKFKAEPKDGYEFDSWTVNGLPADGSFIDPMELTREITAETSVVAHFKSAAPAEEYTVTFAAEPEGQGTLTATRYDRENDEEVPFESGEKFSGENIYITFNAKPGADYKVEKWIVNDEAIEMPSNPNQYVHELKADVNVKVVFTTKPNEVTLKYSVPTGEGGQIAVAVTPAGGGDAVSVESGKKVARGSSVTFTATPNDGYEVEKWLVNGTENREAGQNTTLTMTLEEDTDVQLYFKKEAKKYVVNFTAEPVKGGTITASGYVNGQLKTITTGESVPESSYIDFEVTANEGYEFVKWTVDGVDEEPNFAEPNKRSQEITAETNIVAHFKSTAPAEEYTVTFGADPEEGGTVTATYYDNANEKDVPFDSGAKFSGDENFLTFTAKANDGYQIVSWMANGTDVTPSDPKKIDKLEYEAKEALDLKVVFKKLQKNYKVTLKPTEHGTITIKEKEKVDLNAVPEGTKLTVVAKGANDKCELTKLTANGEDILENMTFTVTKDTEVVAVFVDHTGVDAVATMTLTVYPNPAREAATVTGLAPEATVALYTLDGELIARLHADRSGSLQIDLTALSDGTYLVVTEGATQRLVVKH